MPARRVLPKSKRFYILSMALVWAIPMGIIACAIFWKLGALTIVSALALILLAIVSGIGFAATFYALVKRKYGPAKDE